VLRIDKSFVLNMASDADDETIVRSTITLSHNLGLAVVAEGVKTKEAWNTLARLACDIVQGYYLSRLVPADALQLGWREPARRAAAS
jgi:EAL domain-containing protein (putative c-di-GMP-specific phosphodiesterase class I)